jgi:hypothetical protein
MDRAQHVFLQALVVGRTRARAHSFALEPLRHGMG